MMMTYAAKIEELIAERDKLRAELAELRRDAERYRWLRDAEDRSYVALAMENGSEPVWISGDELDAAIDAAMATTVAEKATP
jgi:hypothetical protein